MKRKRSQEDSGSEEEWPSCSSASKTKKSTVRVVPSETSKWTIHDLRKVNISFSESKISCPDELIDKFEQIKRLVPNLNEDYMKVYDYVQSKLDFDYPLDNLKQMNRIELCGVLEMLDNLCKDLTSKNDDDGNQSLQQTLKEESQFMIDRVRVMGTIFISELIDFIVKQDMSPSLPETTYLSLLQSFCRICNFNGSFGVPKKTREICGVQVVAVPDLIYNLPLNSTIGWFSTTSIISVAEVKKKDIKGPVENEKRQTRSSEGSSEQTFEPENVRGAAPHTGQLLLANPESFFPFHSLGIILNETKVMFTCLVLTKNYKTNMEKKLEADDSGVVYTCGPYDIMKADDRQILLQTFLRLGCSQNVLSRTTSS